MCGRGRVRALAFAHAFRNRRVQRRTEKSPFLYPRRVLCPPDVWVGAPLLSNLAPHTYTHRLGVPRFFELWRDPGLAPSFPRSAHAARETVSLGQQCVRKGWESGTARGGPHRARGRHGVVCSLRVPAPSLKPYPPAQKLSEPHYFKNQRHFILF